MERTEIKILLMRKKITQAAIARKLEIKPATVCNVIKGTSESQRVKRAIAQVLGMGVQDLWPNNKRAA